MPVESSIGLPVDAARSPRVRRIYVGAGEMTVKEALEAYRNGELKKFQGV